VTASRASLCLDRLAKAERTAPRRRRRPVDPRNAL